MAPSLFRLQSPIGSPGDTNLFVFSAQQDSYFLNQRVFNKNYSVSLPTKEDFLFSDHQETTDDFHDQKHEVHMGLLVVCTSESLFKVVTSNSVTYFLLKNN